MRKRRRRNGLGRGPMLIGAAVVVGGVVFFMWWKKNAAAAAASQPGTVVYGDRLLTPAAVFAKRGAVLPAGLSPIQQQEHAVQLIANTGASRF
jgi:hypothetical protein